MSSEASKVPESLPAPESPRRSVVVQLLTMVLSFVLVTIPAGLGGLFYLDPILRKKKGSTGLSGAATRKDEAGFIRLDITSDSIPADGTPVSVTVLDDIVDAWNRFSNVPIGSIWLRKVGDGPVLAFSSICPHLGCSVNFRQAEGDFFCPCHTSAFALDGKKKNEVPPRDMDSLSVSMRTDGKEDPAGREIWIRYEKYRGARADKVAIT